MIQQMNFNGVSMAPCLKDGDTIGISFGSDIEFLGQIVLVENDKELVCHRVINLTPLETKGDRALYYDTTPKFIGTLTTLDMKNIRQRRKISKAIAWFSKINKAEVRFRKPIVLLIIIFAYFEIKTLR
jgi:hypothetical protein